MNIYKPHLVFYVLLLISSFSFSQQQNKEKISIRIVDGFNNHDWQQTTKVVTEILNKTNLFKIDVSTTPPTQKSKGWKTWKPKFKKYDVIIQNTNSHGNRSVWPLKVQKTLEKYIKSGGSMYILHSANNAFPKWEAYNEMIGMGWRPKNYGKSIIIDENESLKIIPIGEGENTSHGKRIDAVLTKFAEHPINSGYPKQWKAADLEIYSYPRGPIKNTTVLSYSKEPKTQLNFPTEWVVNYGKGYIYNSTYGHVWEGSLYPNSVRCIAFQTALIRTLEWLGTKKITWRIPDNFPSKHIISLTPLEIFK